MSHTQYTYCKRFICFGLALLLGLGALFIIVPLTRSKTLATPDPLMVSDKAYAEKDAPSQRKTDVVPSARESRIDWNAWRSINPDLVGWLTIPSLDLSLPLVQARRDNPLFYLDHDIYGNENIYGCPYLDADCAEEGLNSRHAIILGHSLTDGSIFSPLLAYAEETFALSHREVVIYTPKKTFAYTIRRASIVPGNEQAKRSAFDTEEDFFRWLFEEDARALYTLDSAPATCGLSLVTCSYFQDPTDERFVLFCTPQTTPAVSSPEAISAPQNQMPQNQPSGLLKLPDTGPAIMK